MSDARRPGRLHHVGITVADIDTSLAFWERLLGAHPRGRATLDGPLLGGLVGYPGVRMERCWIDLPDGVALELLQYLDRHDVAYPPGTAHPGNVHVCLQVDDMAGAHAHALACGAEPVGEGPIQVPAGASAGARIAYLRDPDGVTIELFQPPDAEG